MAFKSLVESVAGGRPWPLFPHMAMMAFLLLLLAVS